MVVVSYSGREINAKLVYYGTGLSGKTTNLEFIYASIPATSRGKMVSMKTQNDRTLFFDLLPVDLGEISGFKTRFMLYTVPGQVFYNATRKLVLRGADAIVFVADSERGKMDENKESLQNLVDNLREYSLSLDQVPWVIQYNKRDLPNVYSVAELNRELNPTGVPFFEGVAFKGNGVFETFRGVSRLLLENLNKELKLGSKAGASNVTGGASRNLILPPSDPRGAGQESVQSQLDAAIPFAGLAASPSPTAPNEFTMAPAEQARSAESAPAYQESAGSSETEMPSWVESTSEAGPGRHIQSASSPSLARRFASWWKSGKQNEAQTPSEAPAPSAPPVIPQHLSIGGQAPPQRGPVEEEVPVGMGAMAAPAHSTAPAIETFSRVTSPGRSPSAPARAQNAPDVPMSVPDFSGGFSQSNLPASIPAGPAPRSILAGPQPASEVVTADASGAAEKKVNLALQGLRPGQKVRIHVIVQVEAVEG